LSFVDTNNELLDPDNPSPTASSPLPTIDREVYFASTTSAIISNCAVTVNGTGSQFYPSTVAAPPGNPIPVAPGAYALVGPGEFSPTYQTDSLGKAHPKRTYLGFLTTAGGSGTNLTRFIDLDPSAISGFTPPLPVQNNVNNPLDPTTAATVSTPATLAIDTPHRLSVSEPINTTTLGPAYHDYDAMEAMLPGATRDTNGMYVKGGIPTAFDVPFDVQRDDLDHATFQNKATTPQFRVLYLQRLANPLLPWNLANNPYRTVDAMAVDLTVFNGIGSGTDPIVGTGVTHFETRQRGDYNDIPGQSNLWKQEPVNKTSWAVAPPPAVPGHYFTNGLKHSLGYLNQGFGQPTATPYPGDPASPFPWLTANSRPYVSPLELLLVPTCSSSKLLINAGVPGDQGPYNKYFGFVDLVSRSPTPMPYNPGSIIQGTLAGSDVPYPHLMNFFQSTASNVTGPTGSPQFHRILEYLSVPSPFVGTETWASPPLSPAPPPYASVASPYLPPFNRLSAYREPGRINLNTIYTSQVFSGLMNGITTPSWNNFVMSRRGDTQTSVLAPPLSLPTEFAYPFRSFGGWLMTPSSMHPKTEIDCTMLRQQLHPIVTNQPLFQPTISTSAYNNMNRNPFFRYQGLERLANLVTTRSNVYAVWITVGYFEVTPNPTGINPGHPDGYQLGRELGIDTGEIQRHRAFYIIDRTIPVGFQRGQDMNVEKAILVNRFIE
jgi:hypothetical protein